MKTIITIFLSVLYLNIYAQEKSITDTIKREAIIEVKMQNNTVIYSPIVPELHQISGAPKAFYTYYWEFDDGEYSMKQSPTHIYPKTGSYNTKLWVTNNYDAGKAPSTRPKKIVIDKVSAVNNEKEQSNSELSLRRNREPMPEEDFVVIMSYRNSKDYPLNGKLYLFYNESKYKSDNFEITDSRVYNDERQVSEEVFATTSKVKDERILFASTDDWVDYYTQIERDSLFKTDLPKTLDDSKVKYKDFKVFEFDDMEQGGVRNLFFTFKTTPEMLKDTSATISIRGVYVPDRSYDNHSIKDMEMEIVTSHDPNKMSNDATFMSYRFVENKKVNYKVRFQNNGEGPAKTIRLEVDVPDMYDKSSIVIEDLYPFCNTCISENDNMSCIDTTFTKDKVIFTFKNIYLPGSNQKGVMDIDSTKGFVKYSIKFNEDFHKKKTRSRTAIIFDKNEPIYTNYSSTRFLTGISVGVKAGYNYYEKLADSKNYFIGATISPYKSYRWYLQAETTVNFHEYNSEDVITSKVFEGDINLDPIIFTKIDSIGSNINNIDFEVPILVRFNVNSYIGIGMGLQGTVSVSNKQTSEVVSNTYDTRKEIRLVGSKTYTESTTDLFTNFRGGLLFDFTAGFSRIGPSLGARYILSTNDEFSHWQLYAIWKF